MNREGGYYVDVGVGVALSTRTDVLEGHPQKVIKFLIWLTIFCVSAALNVLKFIPELFVCVISP